MINQWDWSFVISLFANTSVTVMVIVFAPVVTWRLITRWAYLEHAARLGMLGVVVLAWYLIFRVGYWSPTMWLSDVGTDDRYHAGWMEFRWTSYVAASFLGLLALWLHIRAFLPWRRRMIAIVLGISILAGTVVGVTWQMSELGHWFDRQKVIEVHDRFFGFDSST